jgi:hypothetical protein
MSILEHHALVPSLDGVHRRTYEAIYRNPTAHNLEWGDVRRLLETIAEVSLHDGRMKVSRNGLTLHLADGKNHDSVSLPDVKRIRKFLTVSERHIPPEQATDGQHWLVVIDHAVARIYRTGWHGAEPVRITPHDPDGHHRRVHSSHADGKHTPPDKAFYEAVAESLGGAGHVLLFGSGTGGSSTVRDLFANLERFHPGVAKRVIGRVVVDPHHTTEDQLLAKAREFYATHRPE